MDLHYLKIFYEVAKESSFTKAANNLFINQSAVSIQIKKFESNMGVKLFERGKKKIKMTYAGEVLFKTAEDIFQKVKRAEKEMEKVINMNQGKIIIGATHIIGEPILPKIIKEFKELNVGIDFEIHIQERDVLIEKVKDGKLDVVLMGDYYIKDRGLEVIPITDYPFVLVYNQKLANFKDLEGLPLIGRDDSSMLDKNVDYFERKYSVKLSEKLVVNGSVETVKNMVKEGIGYTILPYYCLYKEIKDGELFVLVDLKEFKNGYQAIITEDKSDNIEMKKFLEFIKLFRI